MPPKQAKLKAPGERAPVHDPLLRLLPVVEYTGHLPGHRRLLRDVQNAEHAGRHACVRWTPLGPGAHCATGGLAYMAGGAGRPRHGSCGAVELCSFRPRGGRKIHAQLPFLGPFAVGRHGGVHRPRQAGRAGAASWGDPAGRCGPGGGRGGGPGRQCVVPAIAPHAPLALTATSHQACLGRCATTTPRV